MRPAERPRSGKLNGTIPGLRGDLVVGKQSLIAAESLSLDIVGDPAPQLKPHRWTPRGLAALEQRVDAIAVHRVTAFAQLVDPQ